MRKIGNLFLISLTLCFSGCDDRDAQNYAQELIGVLESYQSQVSEKIKAEKASYKELAAVYERGRSRGLESALRQERRERSRKLAVEMLRSDHYITSAEILASLRDYGETDFDNTRKLMELEADALTQFLGDIEGLEFDMETISSLKEALKDLSKPKGQFKQLRDVAVFAKKSKEEFDSLACEDLSTELANAQKQLDEWKKEPEKNKAKIVAFQELIQQLNEQKSATGCTA